MKISVDKKVSSEIILKNIANLNDSNEQHSNDSDGEEITPLRVLNNIDPMNQRRPKKRKN